MNAYIPTWLTNASNNLHNQQTHQQSHQKQTDSEYFIHFFTQNI